MSKLITIGLISLSILTSQPATAQTSSAAQVEEIIVTASKRESSIQDLPMSITALQSDTLDLMGAQNVTDFATFIPSVSYGFGSGDGRNALSFSIRGISGSRTTGFYVDETPLPNFVQPRMVDVARVEVLRGPQGTLYGASSMGGTIRIISNQPNTSEFEGLVDLEISNTEHGDMNYKVEGVVNIPLSQDKAALRLVGYIEDQDGVFDRTFPSASDPTVLTTIENVDNNKIKGFQASLGLTPNDKLNVVAKIAYNKQESDGASWSSSVGDFDQNRLVDIAEFLDDEWTHAALTFNYSGDRFDFTSASSYFDREYIENEDITEIIQLFFGIPYPTNIDQIEDEERFIQEFRLSSNSDGPIQYIVGLYYSDIDRSAPSLSEPEGFEAAFAESIGLPGVPVFGGSDLVFSGMVDVSIEELAVFSEVSFELSERTALTVGARWFDVETDLFALDTGIVADGVPATVGKTSETGINPKVAIDFEVNDSVTVYGSAAKGYRNGGISGFIPDFCGPDVAAPSAPYDSDSLWSYEVGAKTALADNSVHLNGAVFFIDWDDIQQGKSFPCGFGQTVNAGKARSQGFDLEFVAAPIEGLELTAGIGFADAEIRSTEPDIIPKTGDRLLQVPEWTANASIYYSFPVSFAESAYLNANYSYTGDSVTIFPDDPAFSEAAAVRDSYDLLHIRAGFQFATWQASIFVQNVFDENANLSEVISLAAEIPGFERYATNRPRTIGVQMRKNF